jgi:hypothetical protein
MRPPLVEIDWHGLTCVGRVVTDDWEGDPSVPRGVRFYGPYVEDLEVLTSDSTDLYHNLTEATRDDIMEAIIEAHTGQ